jgi:uncharacterized membrane protein
MNALIRKLTQILLGATLTYTGTLHLTTRRLEFQAQVPPWVPFTPDFIVIASGVVEITLGLLLISHYKRRTVGIATAAFFIAIFPGNISQFVHGIDAFGLNDDRARAIRLLFQPLLVLWALWSTTAMPKGSFKRFWNYIKKTIRENKVATVIGILIGGVGTRFLEDRNLLVTTVLTGITTTATLLVWIIAKKTLKYSKK